VIRATAPGKLMVAGEYGIVYGGTASLAVTVGRRITVEVRSGGRGWSVRSESHGVLDGDPSAVPVVDKALAHVRGIPPGGLISIESELGGPEKLGLGSSAALCVATVGALRRLAGSDEAAVDEVIMVHRAAQGGRGSGYDVAAALLGGATLYERSGDTARARRVPWPEGLHAAVFYTGHPASTVDLLDRVAAWRAEDPEDMQAYLTPLAEESRELIDAWLAGDVPRLLTAMAQVQEELDAFDRAGEIGIYGGGQMQLLAALEDAGAVARTSGAGGGDCVWAFSSRPAVLERATAAAEALGFTRIAVELEVPGLTVEEVA